VTALEHVIVLALENRSFDHMLGYLEHPGPGFDGLRVGGPFTNPGWDNGHPVAASPGAKPVLPVDPDHSHDAVMEQLGLGAPGQAPTNSGFVTSYERKGRGLAQPQFEGLLAPLITWWNSRGTKSPPITGRGPLVMLCQDPANVPVLSTLALHFGVCTRWFCSVPGETWPNRNFLHAATSDGETDIDPRFYSNPTIFELLERAGRSWRIYYDDTPQVWAFKNLWDSDERRANWFRFTDLLGHLERSDLPTYSFIEPNHRPPVHTLDHEPIAGAPDVSDSQHPGNNLVANDAYDTFTSDKPTDFGRAEQLIATVYEALRANPALFAKTLLLVTYDEHGGLYDHVPPPTDAVPPGDLKSTATSLMHLLYRRKSQSFDFKTLGPRVPAIVISPLVEAGAICADVFDHASVPATLRQLFAPDQAPLTPRDAAARPFTTLVTRSEPRLDLPDLSAHTMAAPAPGPASGTLGGMAPSAAANLAAVPDHFKDLVSLADMVRGQLQHEGLVEPKVSALPPLVRAARTTEAFDLKAGAARAAGVAGKLAGTPEAPPGPPGA